MEYTNSPLVNIFIPSPNYGSRIRSTNPDGVIDTITIHHMAGNLSVELCGEIFSRPERQASSNYGIGSDGRMAMYVEEKNRSWCSCSATNDSRAITIEVANSQSGGDWPISDTAMKALVALCADICDRNTIKQINFTGNTSGNLTMHKWFAATACPGPYLSSKFEYIQDQVNKIICKDIEPDVPEQPVGTITSGDVVRIRAGSTYYGTRTAVPSWIIERDWIVAHVGGDRVVINESVDGVYAINSAVYEGDLTLIEDRDAPKPEPEDEQTSEVFEMQLKILRKGDEGGQVAAMQAMLIGFGYEMKSGNTVYGADGDFGAATESAVKKFQENNKLPVNGVCDEATWNTLFGNKASVVPSKPAEPAKPAAPAKPAEPVKVIKKGSVVRINKGAKTYTGGKLASFVYSRDSVVTQLDGDRAVVSYNGSIVAAVNVKDLTLVR